MQQGAHDAPHAKSGSQDRKFSLFRAGLVNVWFEPNEASNILYLGTEEHIALDNDWFGFTWTDSAIEIFYTYLEHENIKTQLIYTETGEFSPRVLWPLPKALAKLLSDLHRAESPDQPPRNQPIDDGQVPIPIRLMILQPKEIGNKPLIICNSSFPHQANSTTVPLYSVYKIREDGLLFDEDPKRAYCPTYEESTRVLPEDWNNLVVLFVSTAIKIVYILEKDPTHFDNFHDSVKVTIGHILRGLRAITWLPEGFEELCPNWFGPCPKGFPEDFM